MPSSHGRDLPWESDLVACRVVPEPGPGTAVKVSGDWSVLHVIWGAMGVLN